MSTWFDDFSLAAANEKGKNCMLGLLGIELVEKGDDYLVAEMPVDHRVKQPAGVLHGGASVVLAETVGTWAATMAVDRAKHHCVGIEINANHVRAVTEGKVIATARPVHIGRSTHVWQIDIRNQAGKLTCSSRMTVAVLDTASGY
jgi:1,4-dihydroxy-2-naphthoyl-CoA hydrolase